MDKVNKISLKHGYTLTIDENDMVIIDVDDYTFEGYKGCIFDAGTWVDELDEPFQTTLDELIDYADEMLADYGIDGDTIVAILKDLTPWFERYAKTQEEMTAIRITELESWIKGRQQTIADLIKRNDMHRLTIEEQNRKIEANTGRILELDAEIKKFEKLIRKLKVQSR